MPRMGEGIVECTILDILKKEGEHIEADDSVMEVATDKVDTEVPAPCSGIIKEILVKINDVVPIGSVVMRIESAAGAVASSASVVTDFKTEPVETEEIAQIPFIPQTSNSHSSYITSSSSRFYSPLVRTIATKEGISVDELEQINGTGAEGRVTKADILEYVKRKNSAVGSRQSIVSGLNEIKQPSKIQNLKSEIEIIPMDRMRKMIAERMVESKRISAHVTSFVECDMTNVVKWRNATKEQFKQQTGENLTYTPILIQAIVKAIQEFPNINISVEGDNIIKKPDINIGMAVALPSGNLIVPVIHNADRYDLAGLSKKVNDLANRARNNKLTPEDLVGGTYTISNIGMFGNLMGTPIILQPQVAIMAFGVIQKRPVVIEHADGDFIGIRSMMYLSHSYDHRVVDGALGGMFVKRVADYLAEYSS